MENGIKNDNKNVADIGDAHILIRLGVIRKCYKG